jgi:hypothetical protein
MSWRWTKWDQRRFERLKQALIAEIQRQDAAAILRQAQDEGSAA